MESRAAAVKVAAEATPPPQQDAQGHVKGGVLRQSLPDAHSQRLAAARVSGDKRFGSGMSPEERAERRNAAKRARRAPIEATAGAAAARAAEAEGTAGEAAPSEPAIDEPAEAKEREPEFDAAFDELMDANYPGCLGPALHDIPSMGFRRGQQARIEGLVHRTDLNGQLATLKVWHDAYDPERWEVEFASSERLLVKTINLRHVALPSSQPRACPRVKVHARALQHGHPTLRAPHITPHSILISALTTVHRSKYLPTTAPTARSSIKQT